MIPSNPQLPNAKKKNRPKIKGNISSCIVPKAVRDPPRLIRRPGCYQCSRRRIDCDRQQPSCAKCTTKGLTCSGLGIRYRFNGSLASRGKLVGETIPARLSYGGEADAGRSNLIIASKNASHISAQSFRSERKCAASHDEGFRSPFDDPRMSPQRPLSGTKDSGRATQEDKDTTITLGRCLTQVEGKTQYLMQYCTKSLSDSHCHTELITFHQLPHISLPRQL